MSQKNEKQMGFYESRSGIFFSIDTKEEFRQILENLPNLNNIQKEEKIQENFDDFDKIVDEVSKKADPK